ncbi:hypothetical protein HPP92_014774 [Vanilla planifolia]|uniref:DNA-binding protein RHL1 n=1 Tax=Vanilla planifolia TaxID=51239 RepID=A0A835QS97_VANPL|nr:hypothetical protein HPP92_014774 [Vanilla planifolia]
MGRKGEEENAQPAVDPEAVEKKRLRSLAVSKRLLRRSPAKPSAPLEPSKAVFKLQGRDILKRGQRKSRYLFSFPGLIAPISGGKVGELANLATKNPVLYLEFPQGRMKLFGTHVYPKNKYLSLQLSRSTKGVVCEDVFESLIVFSEAWWIGHKEENPEEQKLEFPKDIKEGKNSDYDFKGGAGATHETSSSQKSMKEYFEKSLDDEIEDDGSDSFYTEEKKDARVTVETTPTRQSTRTAGKTMKYEKPSSSEESSASDTKAAKLIARRHDSGFDAPTVCSPDDGNFFDDVNSTRKTRQSTPSEKATRKTLKGTLVQTKLSNLFEKVVEKKSKQAADDSFETKSPGGKRQRLLAKEKTSGVQVKAVNKKVTKSRGKNGAGSRDASKKLSQEADVWNEDISSESQDEDDEDWTA